MKTYREVAESNKMPLDMEIKYISYMRIRWADTEEQKCLDGYAQEWAERFLAHRELAASDSIGQRILREDL